jgi:energy-converting hydrogenase Eha subunit H
VSKFFSRKFILALLFTLAACAALFVGDKIDGAQFVALAGIILGAFTAGDVAINAIHRNKADPDNPDPDNPDA